ncbi:hypothetical protein CAEBREN_06696 [Caenorhabditis brenneri]|uniref:F-box domain-containing protein n=1 Tax=Caenorhabditis brenneri TaxID=135651 RepID=G0M8H3_CAEBE|nr:hypothetical protein CAEBREN_06696 [Caenorhabditis brenneri]
MAPRKSKKTVTAVQPVRKSARLQKNLESDVAAEQDTAIVEATEIKHFNLEDLPPELVYKIIEGTSIFGLFNLSITSHLLRHAVGQSGLADISIDVYNEESRLRSESSSKSVIVFEGDPYDEVENDKNSTMIGNTRILVEEDQYYDHAITRIKSTNQFKALADFLAYLKPQVKSMSVSVMIHDFRNESFNRCFQLDIFDLFDKIEVTRANGIFQERNYERLKRRVGDKFQEPE